MSQRILQIERRTMLVAPNLDVTIGNTTVTLNGCLRCNDALGKQRQCLCRLKGGARCLRLADSLPHIKPFWGICSQTDNLTISWIDSHNSPRLTLKQSFSQLLQHRSKGQRSVCR